MSILIKDMEMPESCVSCRWYKRLGCELEDLVTNAVQGCPLTEVPTPHGRLIDADELETDAEWSEHYDDCTAFSRAQINAAPTIIEAEYNCITDEIAQKIIEEVNKACANCQEWVCDECEYRHWRNKK